MEDEGSKNEESSGFERIDSENKAFQDELLTKESVSEKVSNDSVVDNKKFITGSTFADLGISPYYIGRFLKDTVRNDNKVCSLKPRFVRLSPPQILLWLIVAQFASGIGTNGIVNE